MGHTNNVQPQYIAITEHNLSKRWNMIRFGSSPLLNKRSKNQHWKIQIKDKFWSVFNLEIELNPPTLNNNSNSNYTRYNHYYQEHTKIIAIIESKKRHRGKQNSTASASIISKINIPTIAKVIKMSIQRGQVTSGRRWRWQAQVKYLETKLIAYLLHFRICIKGRDKYWPWTSKMHSKIETEVHK